MITLPRFRRPDRVQVILLLLALTALGAGYVLRPPSTWYPAIRAFYWICFFLPLLTLLQRRMWPRIYSLWLCVFLVLQSFVPHENIYTMAPNLVRTFTVTDGLPGIEGMQLVSTDDHGFRTTKPVNYENKPDNTYRIFAIGASTTVQIYLDDHSTWTHLLQQKLQAHTDKNVEVINVGLSGLRTYQHAIMLRAIQRYEPDMVIFLFGINDWQMDVKHFLNKYELATVPLPQSFMEQVESHVSTALLRFRKDHAFNQTLLGNMLRRAVDYFSRDPDLVTEIKFKEKKGGPYIGLRGTLYRLPSVHYMMPKVRITFTRAIEKIIGLCKGYEIECVFLTQPNGFSAAATEQYKRGLWMTPPEADYTLDIESMEHLAKLYNGHIVSTVKKHGLPLCDVAPHFPASYQYLYDDCHFNTAGAKFMADLLFPCVSARIPGM